MPISSFGTLNFEDADSTLPLEVGQIAPNGVWQCDPSLSSPEIGALLVERLVTIGARLATKVAT